MLFRLAFWIFTGFALLLLALLRFSLFVNQINLRLSREEIGLVLLLFRGFGFVIKLFKGLKNIEYDILGLLPVIAKDRQLTNLFAILINVYSFVFSFKMVMGKGEMIKSLARFDHNRDIIVEKHILEHFKIVDFGNNLRLGLFRKLCVFVQFRVIIQRIVVVFKLIWSVGCWIRQMGTKRNGLDIEIILIFYLGKSFFMMNYTCWSHKLDCLFVECLQIGGEAFHVIKLFFVARDANDFLILPVKEFKKDAGKRLLIFQWRQCHLLAFVSPFHHNFMIHSWFNWVILSLLLIYYFTSIYFNHNFITQIIIDFDH